MTRNARPSRILYCADFPALQAKFVAEVGASRRDDPLAPLEVLVPGHLLRLSLARALAKSGCSHANLRFLTLAELARHAAEPILQKRHSRLLPDVARGPILKEIIETHAARLQYFSEVATRRGFREALWSTLTELEHADLSPEILAKLGERSGHSVLSRKLTDLVLLWQALRRTMARAHFVNQIELLHLARQHWERNERPPCPLVVYGVHRLSAVERRFLQTAMSGRPVAVYLPFRDLPAYQWVKPLFEWCCGLQFTPQFLTTHTATPRNVLQRVQHDWMSARSGLPADPFFADGSLLMISAPGAPREAEEIVRELLFPPSGISESRSTAVHIPGNDPLADLLREELEAAGVQAYLHERRLADTSTGRALRRLMRLLDGRFRRTDVTELLMATPLKRPPFLPESLSEIPAAEWNQFSLLAGITEGDSQWFTNLQRLRRRFEREIETDDEESHPSSARRLSSLAAMVELLQWLFDRIREIAAARTWLSKSDLVWKTLDELVEPDQFSAALKSEFVHAADLDRLALPVTEGGFTAFVETALFRPVARSGRFQVNDPAVGTASELLGVISDEVFIPGLGEKQVPPPVHHDPLLLDDDRALIEQAGRVLGLPVSLPRRSDLKHRESFLFHAAVTCATNRLVLSYSRLDLGKEGRERLPSSFLLYVLEAATGEPADYEQLDHFIIRYGRKLCLNRLRPQSETAASRFQFDVARLADALHRKSSAPLADLLASGMLTRGALADRCRFHSRGFTAYDGLIDQAAFRTPQDVLRPQRISPTRMEEYATCPFRYFARHVLELEEVPEPAPVQQITPLQRGLLIHEILEDFFRTEQATHRLPLEPGCIPRLQAVAHAHFTRFEQHYPTGLPVLWQVEQQQIVRALTAYVRGQMENQREFIPAHFELRYGEESPVNFQLANGRELAFHGKVDRVDVAQDGRARVIDYKSGRAVSHLKNGKLSGGRALQLPVYRLGVEATLKLDVESSQYHFVSPRASTECVSFTDEDWRLRQNDIVRVLTAIADGIAAGEFFPWPEPDKCANCPVRAACGPGRFTVKWHYDLAQTARLREMSEIE